MERKLNQTMDMIVAKKRRVAMMEREHSQTTFSKGDQEDSFLQRLWGSVAGAARMPLFSDHTAKLKEEISNLEEFSRHIFLELVELRNMQERIEYSKTFLGKYFNVLGHFFSIYCIWKIFICTVNIVFDRVGKVDPVTKGLEIAVKHMGFQIDVSS